MPTVFIANMAVILPSRFAEGDTMTETAAEVLNNIQLRRIRSRLRWLFSRGEIAEEELQAKADELSEMELTAYSSSDDDDPESDPVFVEALSMAREIIITRMAQEGLPPPKGLDIHAKALVDGMVDLRERARLRVEARYKAASEAIAQVL